MSSAYDILAAELIDAAEELDRIKIAAAQMHLLRETMLDALAALDQALSRLETGGAS
jgi:hypothetical protein